MYSHPLDSQFNHIVQEYYSTLTELCLLALSGGTGRVEFEEALFKEARAIYLLVFLLAGDAYTEAGSDVILNQQFRLTIDSITLLADDIFGGRYTLDNGQPDTEMLFNRLILWTYTLGDVYSLGQIYARPTHRETDLTWRRGGTVNPCGDCLELDGVTMSREEWAADGRRPQGSMLECKGYRCQCYFEETTRE